MSRFSQNGLCPRFLHVPRPVDRADRRPLRTNAPYNFVGSPASEQSTHNAANQSARTASTAVMAVPAATTARTVVIGFAAATEAGVRPCDGLGQ